MLLVHFYAKHKKPGDIAYPNIWEEIDEKFRCRICSKFECDKSEFLRLNDHILSSTKIKCCICGILKFDTNSMIYHKITCHNNKKIKRKRKR